MTAYEVVTQRIMDKLQQGIIPWRRPWNISNAVAVNWGSRREYRGINRLLLEPGEYLTFKQVTDAGGRVKKGEHSQIAVFFKSVLQVATILALFKMVAVLPPSVPPTSRKMSGFKLSISSTSSSVRS